MVRANFPPIRFSLETVKRLLQKEQHGGEYSLLSKIRMNRDFSVHPLDRRSPCEEP